MKADAPIEVHQVAVDVVQHLELRALFSQEDRKPAGERLDIASMRRNERKDLAEQSRFAAGPNDGWFDATRCDQNIIVRSGREV